MEGTRWMRIYSLETGKRPRRGRRGSSSDRGHRPGRRRLRRRTASRGETLPRLTQLPDMDSLLPVHRPCTWLCISGNFALVSSLVRISQSLAWSSCPTCPTLPGTAGASFAMPDARLVDSKTTFNAFSHILDARILRALADMGFARPTLVQTKAIPLALENRDILARARTGSGKTAAYCIPVVQKVLNAKSVSPFSTCGLADHYTLFACGTSVNALCSCFTPR